MEIGFASFGYSKAHKTRRMNRLFIISPLTDFESVFNWKEKIKKDHINVGI